MRREGTPQSTGPCARRVVSNATLVPNDLTTSARLARGPAHRASPYVLRMARDLVAAGRSQIGRPTIIWMEPWQTLIRWLDQRRYAILAYHSLEPATQQMIDQLADAFTRSAGKKAVDFRQASPTMGCIFFGGAPPQVKISPVVFHRLDLPLGRAALPDVHPWLAER